MYGVKVNTLQNISNSYDQLSRLSSKSLSLVPFSTSYTYAADSSDNPTTTRLESMTNSGMFFPLTKLSYTYDVKDNIATISENSVLNASYFCDNLDQLVRENNLYINKTITYMYDLGGNLTTKKEYA